jgi:two-component system nitrogen regulation sensor histidine kinase NtrY
VFRGWIRVALSTAEDGTTVAIEDNGIGLPKGLHNRLTEPYVTTRAKGTGLGLAIVKHIVQRHRGHLDIASEPGQGACFTVTLPEASRG